jgi:hypothetical protein
MKILLISPTIDTHKKTNKGLMMPQLSLYLLKGLTPPEHEVITVEKEAEKVDLDTQCNLVGISCMTTNSPRAHETMKCANRLITTDLKTGFISWLVREL